MIKKQIYITGGVTYTLNGILHNPHRPAFTTVSGGYYYRLKGKSHNIVGPANIPPMGNKQYIINSIFI